MLMEKYYNAHQYMTTINNACHKVVLIQLVNKSNKHLNRIPLLIRPANTPAVALLFALRNTVLFLFSTWLRYTGTGQYS